MKAQCASPIVVTPAAPYTDDFEATNGGWTTGGTASDWAWGTPAKATINSAGSGSKCWIAGGLTGSSYANGERSWLQSPCLDLTGIAHPYVNFLVFWETENIFDGASLQYSTDGGLSWRTAGTKNDPVNCLNDNWFNITPVNFVTGAIINPAGTLRDGWAGTIRPTAGSCQGGGGSNGWVTAKHTLPAIAGEPTVIFRFVFGAGTTCNNFDGFAFDKFWVGEAPANQASFTYSCVNATTVNFNSTSLLCPNLNWDFGDPASGANNSSTLTAPNHVFSGPGTYTITLTASGPDNAPSTVTQQVTILGLTPSVQTPVTCNNGTNGAATVAVAPAGTYNYSWNTVPVQNTPTATGLGAGTYTVTVSGTTACPSTATVNLANPAPVSPPVTTPGSRCGPGIVNLSATGSGPVRWYSDPGLAVLVNTGTTYSPNLTVTTTYYVTASSGPCVSTPVAVTATIHPVPAGATASITVTPTCTVPTGTIVISAPLGANFTYSVDGGATFQASPTFAGLPPGTYTLMVKDITSGCVSATSTLIIGAAPVPPPAPTGSVTVQPTCAAPNGTIVITAPLGASYTYSVDGGATYQASTTFPALAPGNYSVIVKDNLTACVSSATAFTVNPVPLSPAAPTASVAVQPTCILSTGTIVVSAPVGAAYMYSIDGGATYQASVTFSGLAPGNYNVTVKDNTTGCVSNATALTVNPVPAPPAAPTASVTVQPGCIVATGTILVSAPVGANFVYSNDNGVTYQASPTFSGLAPGIYSVTVKDNSTGCVSAATLLTVNPVPPPPAAPTASVTVQPACAIPTGTIVVTAPLGASYVYSNDNGATYQASVTFSGLAPGNYSIRVKDNTTGCVSSTTLLTVNPAAGASPPPLAITPVNYCTGATPVALSAIGVNLLWYTSANGANGTATAPTPSTQAAGTVVYYVSQTIPGLCESPRLPVTVNVFPKPTAYAGGPVVNMFPGQAITLNGSASGNNITILWSPSVFLTNATIATPTIVNLDNDQLFTMTVRSAAGCVSTDTVKVNVLQNLIVPNVFSPNGDNINDAWVITYIEKYADARVEVFNRYGQVVFSQTGYGNDWKGTYNGKPLPVGVYYYIINVPLLRQKLSGSVSILR